MHFKNPFKTNHGCRLFTYVNFYFLSLHIAIAISEHGWTALDWYISEIYVQRSMKILQRDNMAFNMVPAMQN